MFYELTPFASSGSPRDLLLRPHPQDKPPCERKHKKVIMCLRRAIRDDECMMLRVYDVTLVTGSFCAMQDLVFLRPVPIQQSSPEAIACNETIPGPSPTPWTRLERPLILSHGTVSHAGPDLWT